MAQCRSMKLQAREMYCHSPFDLNFGSGLGNINYLYSCVGQCKGMGPCVTPYPTPNSYADTNLQGEGVQGWGFWEEIRWRVEPSSIGSVFLKKKPGKHVCPVSYVRTQQEGIMFDAESNHPETMLVPPSFQPPWQRDKFLLLLNYRRENILSSQSAPRQPALSSFLFSCEICHGNRGLSYWPIEKKYYEKA